MNKDMSFDWFEYKFSGLTLSFNFWIKVVGVCFNNDSKMETELFSNKHKFFDLYFISACLLAVFVDKNSPYMLHIVNSQTNQ